MQRHKQLIQLSDHVKNKLKQHQQLPPPESSPFINSSDEFIEIASTDDENELDSPRLVSSENVTRPRCDTYTIYEAKPSSGSFFTDGIPPQNPNVSILQEQYKKQKQCENCLGRDRIIGLQRQDLIRLYNQNKELNHQLRSSIMLNHQYKDDIRRTKEHLNQVNSHLYEYQRNFDHLKQKILVEKKPDPKKKDDEEEPEEEEELTIDHFKRLRYEIQMYNRIVAAKEKQEEKNEQKQREFFV